MDKAKPREAVKVFKLGDKTFHIKKFDAQTGSYIAYQIAMNALPMAMKKDDFVGALAMMNKQQFLSLQAECLKVCFITMDAGELPVVDEKGVYGDPSLKNDFGCIMALTLQALAHNVASFFDAPGSKELLQTFGFQLTKQSDVQTSASSSSSPS